jgi:hypothetical protein
MAGLDYKKLFAEAKEELEKLQSAKINVEDHLENLIARIDAMTATYNAIAPLIGESPLPTIADAFIPSNIEALKAAGISVAARSILDRSPMVDFSAGRVRDALGEKGWDWSNYKNPLSTVHTVLVRLVASGVAREVDTITGAKQFHSTKRGLFLRHTQMDAPIGPDIVGTGRSILPPIPSGINPADPPGIPQRYFRKKKDEL